MDIQITRWNDGTLEMNKRHPETRQTQARRSPFHGLFVIVSGTFILLYNVS
jgi:hypothetical protein